MLETFVRSSPQSHEAQWTPSPRPAGVPPNDPSSVGCKLDYIRTDRALRDKRQPHIAVAPAEAERSPSAAAAAAAVAESALNPPNTALHVAKWSFQAPLNEKLMLRQSHLSGNVLYVYSKIYTRCRRPISLCICVPFSALMLRSQSCLYIHLKFVDQKFLFVSTLKI